ncbi:uncharacterized protein K452DRAFT_15459 [Aplosporella prunicola CBS 121167]|uniref:Uncharacterized protein n=1 Tax=Aplosporella prunicola CBS 121167 TaxID=1176127 RepID=A0A6A6BJT7_9PEZI|nr:uncharacterized protein K452DRAFT_15459 [Aplosporella prunicola CBS 121167]KAF2143087.1 hypothetical protein K452DRAFT_15459 [Aplosporella prunicola CBS 121167]
MSSSANDSHATVCSMRPARGCSNSFRASTPPVVDGRCFPHAADTSPLPPALTSSSSICAPDEQKPFTSYDPQAALELDYPTRGPGTGHSKSLSASFLENCRPLVHRATASISSLTQQSRASLPPLTTPLASSTPSRTTRTTPTLFHSDDDDRARSTQQNNNDNDARRLSFLDSWFGGATFPWTLGLAPNHNTHTHPEPDSACDLGSDSDFDRDDFFKQHMDPVSSFTRAPPSLGQRRREKRESTTSQASTQAPKTSKITSWFSRASSNTHKRENSGSQPHDPLLTLNIEQTLFPRGSPEIFDEATYNDLVANATQLLQQYQASYKVLYFAMTDARGEADAAKDETAEAQVRATNLKSQLDEKARQAARQEEDMRQLMDALNQEKLMRRSRGNVVSKRKSNSSMASTSLHSDSGFESEGETAVDGTSIRDSILSDAGALENEIKELCEQHEKQQAAPETKTADAKPAIANKRRSVFETVMQKKQQQQQQTPPLKKSIIGGGAPKGGKNVQETHASQLAMWKENRDLRERVDQLERAVEESLAVVGTLDL